MTPQPRRAWALLKTGLTAAAAAAPAGLGLFLAWMGGAFHHKVQPGSVPVERPAAAGRTLVPVERLAVEDAVEAVGSVQPRKRTDVASQLLATIREVKVRPGGRVNLGDSLTVLDDRELLAQQREATAALSVAEADLLTAGAAMLGAWPITLDPVFSGLAWSLIFGLVVSTAFTLLLVPVVYWMLYRRADQPAVQAEVTEVRS